MAQVETTRESFAVLAENCPENFLCQSLLLSAEVERIADRTLSAVDLYARAIRYAEETSMLPQQALANELCAKFWLQRGTRKIAAAFMTEAQDCYARWGAAAKVDDLERRYPDLLRRESRSDARRAPDGGAAATQAAAKPDALDLSSVLKAARAIAGEIDLEQLLERLLRIAIENAGAERGSLVLEHDGDFFVHAEGSLDSAVVQVHDGIPLTDTQSLPASIVNYVRRTLEAVVLADALTDDRYRSDPYIQRTKPHSVMCVPVLRQGRLIGILYLENNVVRGAFTPDRIQIMQVLSTDAAISLENAKLVDGLKREIRERKVAQENLHSALDEVGRLKN